MSALVPYLLLLLATLTLEAIVALAIAPRDQRRRVLETLLFLNLLSHPLATLWMGYWNGAFFAVELVVMLLEVVGYRAVAQLSIGRALALGVGANLLSMAAGRFA